MILYKIIITVQNIQILDQWSLSLQEAKNRYLELIDLGKLPTDLQIVPMDVENSRELL